MTAWTCPNCGAPFSAPNASHSCLQIELDDEFARFIREAAARVGRRERLAAATAGAS